MLEAIVFFTAYNKIRKQNTKGNAVLKAIGITLLVELVFILVLTVAFAH